MSSEIVYRCDHCQSACDGNEYASLSPQYKDNKIFIGVQIHGCSREHLGFALAKTFGIPIDGNLAAKLDALRVELNAAMNANNNARIVIADQKTELESARHAHMHLENACNDLRRQRDEVAAEPSATMFMSTLFAKLTLEDDPAGYYRKIVTDTMAELTESAGFGR